MALDDTGRKALIATALASVAAGTFVAWAVKSAVAFVVVLAVGFYVGFIFVSRVGRLGFSPEDSSDDPDPTR